MNATLSTPFAARARRAVARTLALLTLALGPAAALRAGEILDASAVEQALARGAIVWDVRDAAQYQRGHVPGAVNIGNVGTVLRDPTREDWLPVEQVQQLLGDAGIDIVNREVVAYGETGDSIAYYALSGMRHFGAKDGKVFHGGLDAWRASGRAVSTEATVLPKVTLALTPRAGTLIDTREMIERVKAGSTQIIDARTPREYSGDDVRAIRGGHIPNAINLPYEQNWVDPQAGAKLAARQATTRDGMSLKSPDQLAKLYAGLDRDKEVVVYCQSGVRASVTATVLRDLGFKDVKVYEPSWLGYASVLSAPVDDEVFFNVGAMSGRIGSLQSRIVELEAEVTRLKAAR